MLLIGAHLARPAIQRHIYKCYKFRGGDGQVIEQYEPKQGVIARKEAILAGLRSILPSTGVIGEELRLRN